MYFAEYIENLIKYHSKISNLNLVKAHYNYYSEDLLFMQNIQHLSIILSKL